MVKIGITGGIGSGKTTVCEVWQSLGAYIINADDLARNLMVNNEVVKSEIIATFGTESYQPDGSLNRKFLAKEAFEKGRVKELNNIVHPRVPAEVDRLMEKAEQQSYKVAVYEAALLLENLRPGSLDKIVLVLADQQKRVDWVKERDETSEEDIIGRINQQTDFDDFRNLADIIIRNNGTLEDLKHQAREIYYDFINGKKR